MDKAKLRKIFLEKRLRLSRSEYWKLTEDLMGQIRSLEWGSYTIAHIFLPINKYKEIDTFSLIEFFKIAYPEIALVVPRTNFKHGSMDNVLFDHDTTILCRNKFDIPEPIHGQVIDPLQIDLVFMPLLAFDYTGNRVGYGKGFYDRFLGRCKPSTCKVGLSYFSPVDRVSDTNAWDQKMDFCITPGKTWKFTSPNGSVPL